MLSAIQTELSGLATAEEAKIFLAVESGSRAWGFASPDSDFDVRFIYVRQLEWYLSIQKRRDVIEAMLEPDLDFAGWDLAKALLLLRKSNPSLLEWLGSPMVYSQDERFVAEFRGLAERCTSLNSCLRHYLHMAEANWRAYFTSDQVLLKKYLYVLRPVFACRWIERFRSVPPVALQDLLEGASEAGAVAAELEGLLEAKAVTSELGTGPRRHALDIFLSYEVERFQKPTITTKPPVEVPGTR